MRLLRLALVFAVAATMGCLSITPAVAATASTNALLNGSYAFYLSGYDSQNHAVALAGSMVADGKGNLTGVFDINAAGQGVLTNSVFSGTYSVVSNFRGTMSLTSAIGPATFVFSLSGISNGVATQGGINQTAQFPMAGVFYRQDTSAFALSALASNYSFAFHAANAGSPESYTGYVGNFTSDTSGALKSGAIDGIIGAANGLSASSVQNAGLTGSYTISANGRGTATFTFNGGALNLVFYVVSANRWIVLGTQTGVVLNGLVLRQSGGPFVQSSLNGNIVATQDAGMSGNGQYIAAGLLNCDGKGTVNFIDDESTAGAYGNNTFSGGAPYSIAANGRLSVVGTAYPVVGVVVAPNTLFMLNVNGLAEVDFGEPQSGAPFSKASLQGAYSLSTQPFGGQVSDRGVLQSGTLVADGNGGVTGTQDILTAVAPNVATNDLPLQTGQPISNGYSIDSTGHIIFTDKTTFGYVVSPSKAYLIDLNVRHHNPTVQVLNSTGATADITPQTGWWWDSKLNGTGFFLEYGGVSAGGIFVAGFLYDSAGNNTWLVSTGQMSGSAYTNNWLKVSGGQTLTGPYVAPTGNANAGTIGLNFTSPTTAVMTRPDGSQINLTRFSFSSVPIPAPVAGAPETGWWWGDPNQPGLGTKFGSGIGYGIEIQGTSVFIVAFVYDASGNPVWYLATGFLTTPTTYTGTWDVYAGGPTLTSPEGTYSAHKVTSATPMSLVFSDASHGTLTMGSVVIPITRFQSY